MVLYRSVHDRRNRLQLSAGLVLASLILASLLVDPQTDLRGRWGLPFHLFQFLLGIFVADLVGHLPLDNVAKRFRYDVVFLAGLVVGGAVGLAMTRNDAKMICGSYALAINAASVLSTLLLFAGALAGRRASRLLLNPAVRMVGTMCYSLYLTHIIVMTCLTEILGRHLHLHTVSAVYGVVVGTLMLGSTGVGAAFYLIVERPITRYLSGRKLRTFKEQTNASAPVVPEGSHPPVGPQVCAATS